MSTSRFRRVDLAPLVTGQAQEQVVDAALRLEPRHRFNVLDALAPRLPAPLAARVVQEAAEGDDVLFIQMMNAIGEHLVGSALADAVTRARRIENPEARARALESFAMIPREAVEAEVDELLASSDDARVVWTVKALAGHLDDTQRELLVARARRCADRTAVAAALVAVAGEGPERLNCEALSAVLELRGQGRLWLLAGAPSSDSEDFRAAVADGQAAPVRHCLHLDDDLAIAREHVEHLEVLDRHIAR